MDGRMADTEFCGNLAHGHSSRGEISDPTSIHDKPRPSKMFGLSLAPKFGDRRLGAFRSPHALLLGNRSQYRQDRIPEYALGI